MERFRPDLGGTTVINWLVSGGYLDFWDCSLQDHQTDEIDPSMKSVYRNNAFYNPTLAVYGETLDCGMLFVCGLEL